MMDFFGMTSAQRYLPTRGTTAGRHRRGTPLSWRSNGMSEGG